MWLAPPFAYAGFDMNSPEKKIHILGAGGFIGGYLAAHLSRSGSGKVTGYSSLDCNLLDSSSIASALDRLNEYDVLVVTSAITRLVDNSPVAMTKNVSMIKNLCDFLMDKRISQIVFLSTVDVYGLIQEDVVVNEQLPPNPNDHYSLSKLTSENILRKECETKSVPLTILRLPGVYGPGDKGKSTISALVTSAEQTGKITISGDGRCLRDFVYVADLCRLINFIVKEEISLTVNVASGQSHCIIDIANFIKSKIGRGCVLSFESAQRGEIPERTRDMLFDTALLRSHFPAMEFTPIYRGIENYLEHLALLQDE